MSKFKVGDKVHCYREATDRMFSFDFFGEVLAFTGIHDDEEEYIVSNAPFLLPGMPIRIWESEMSPCEE
jgi:hypothetical protein